MARDRNRIWRDALPPLLLILILVLVWQLVAEQGGLSAFILPSPTGVAQAAWETRSLLLPAIGSTLVATMIGLAIATLLGIAIAAAIDLSAVARRALYPILVASQTVQILAIAPC